MTLSQQLLNEQNECSFSWITADGSPAATVVSFVAYDDAIWMTALAGSARVRALQRNPKSAVVVSGKGTIVGHSRCLSLRGQCTIVNDRASRQRFFPAFASAVLRNSSKGAQTMATSMNSPENLVLKFIATKSIPYDSQAMFDAADRL